MLGRMLRLSLLFLLAFTPPNVSAFSLAFPVATTLGRSDSIRSSTSLWSTTSQGSDASTMPTPANPPLAKVDKLTSLDDFLNYIDGAPTDSLVVVKFYANSCPLCKRIEIKYKKMSRFYSTAPIQFAEIEKTAHPELFPTLGVDTYPFVQIYRNGQCVAAHGTESDTTFEPIVNDTIQQLLTIRPENWEVFLEVFASPIQANTEKMDRLRAMKMTEVQG